MKKIILYVIGTVVYYFISALVLLILTIIFNISVDNIWFSAIPVTIVAELLLLSFWIWKKVKHKLSANTKI